jgi:acyl-CoA thioester hydrolase
MESMVECAVTFGDLDPMGIVWHGNYFRFMEAGREAFGRAHDLDPMDMYEKGYFTPIVRSFIEHKAPLVYGDVVVVRTWMEPSPAAKIILKYELRHKATGQVVATGETMQVFLTKERKLVLDLPDFYRDWKAARNS